MTVAKWEGNRRTKNREFRLSVMSRKTDISVSDEKSKNRKFRQFLQIAEKPRITVFSGDERKPITKVIVFSALPPVKGEERRA